MTALASVFAHLLTRAGARLRTFAVIAVCLCVIFIAQPTLAQARLASAAPPLPAAAPAWDWTEAPPDKLAAAGPHDLQAFVDEVLALTNQQRAQAGLPPLIIQANLHNAAEWFAGDMAAYDYIHSDHTDRLGRSMSARLQNFGYPDPAAQAWAIAENIAAGQTTPQEVVEAWMNSAPHRANILNPAYCHIGVGYSFSAGTTYDHYWVQDFGCQTLPYTSTPTTVPSSTPTLTPPPTWTPTFTPPPTATSTHTPRPTATPSPTFTITPTFTPTRSGRATFTPTVERFDPWLGWLPIILSAR